GFAIPVDRVRSLVGRAFKRRLMTGDWLVIELEEGEGRQARVRYVFPKGPAHGSDLRPGDILTRVNGEPTPPLFDLLWQMAFLPPGAAVELTGHREDAPLTARLMHLPVPTESLSDRHLGLVASDVSDQENREYQLRFDAGVVVQSVREGGPADRIGVRPGDLVIGLGSYRIRHSDDLLVFLQYVQPADIVKVRVLRRAARPNGASRGSQKEGVLVAE
ncbi:MAG: PDZ domain-containing protein, partial [Planctomycetota bacterium]